VTLLESIPGKRKKKISRNELILKGFIFDFHTRTETTSEGNCIYYCYDIGYVPASENSLLIIKNSQD
jgi:hypothetical protein